jgi:hypothetical protein
MHEPAPEERLGSLLGELRPAPAAWVELAVALPAVRAALGDIHGRVTAGAADRAQLTAELEAALARAELEPTPERVRSLSAALGIPRSDSL